MRYWGKARPPMDRSQAAPFHPLPYHCLDVAAVGVEALRRMPALQRIFAGACQLPEEQLESWVAFWLALHDLGKFAESFQSQCPDVFLVLRDRDPNPAKPYTLRHDSLGMLFWRDVLRESVIDDAWFGAASEGIADGLDWWARSARKTSGHWL